MGLAASQARLLLLTARKSDLEYRAQMICQRKTLLAMQTEELARNYSEAINNRKLYFTYTANSNAGNTVTELLTYQGFTSAANSTRYRLINSANGKIVALDEADAEKYKDVLEGTTTVTTVTTTDDATAEATAATDGTATDEGTETDGTETSVTVATESDDNFDYNWAALLKNPEGLQNAIQSGALLIQKLTTTAENVQDSEGNTTGTRTTRNWNYIALSSMDDVASRYYTDDDASVSAEYEYQSLIIQNADSQLDTELKQVETQQKACETEIDSVKKIIEKNIESSFKTFA